VIARLHSMKLRPVSLARNRGYTSPHEAGGNAAARRERSVR
jgi:hypothetical protein